MSIFYKVMVVLISVSVIVASFFIGVETGYKMFIPPSYQAGLADGFDQGRLIGLTEGMLEGIDKGKEEGYLTSAATIMELCTTGNTFNFRGGPALVCHAAHKNKDVNSL